MLRFVLSVLCLSVAALTYYVRFSVPEAVVTEVDVSSVDDSEEVMQVAADVKAPLNYSEIP